MQRDKPATGSQVAAIMSSMPETVERRHKAPRGECEYCDREREAGLAFHPSHDACPRCESGKHNHCSCDACF